MVKWHKSDLEERQYCSIEGGKKIAMPRYYKDKIYSSEEKGYLKGYNEWYKNTQDEMKIRRNKVETLNHRQQYVELQFRIMNKPDTKNKL
ncbi:MAG: replication initiator protein [Microviridae sp.]|nr:MAG: replication initiator protein [Microviridae sp.]